MAFTFGSRKYSYGIYGGYDTPFPNSTYEAIIELYDNSGSRKNTYQLGISGLYNVEFTHDENGCRDFTLNFANKKNIVAGDIIKIKVRANIDYFFAGVIRAIPIEGSTNKDYIYSGYGLNDYLHRINAESQTLGGSNLQTITEYIVDNIISTKTTITKNIDKIILPDITPTTFDINYVQVIDVLDAIKKMANSTGDYYVFGVDEIGEFFFRPKESDIKVTLIAGKPGIYGINEYNPTEDYIPKTKYFLLDKNGSYINTINSTLSNDIYEEKLTAPDIDNTIAENWAEGKMFENETSNRRASVRWSIEPTDPLLLKADGSIRIIANTPPTVLSIASSLYGSGLYGGGLYGGTQYTGYNLIDEMSIKQVKYKINKLEANREIELGNMPIRLDSTIIQAQKELTDLKISLGR